MIFDRVNCPNGKAKSLILGKTSDSICYPSLCEFHGVGTQILSVSCLRICSYLTKEPKTLPGWQAMG